MAEGERPASAGALRLQILGPLRLWRDGEELHAGPRQQAQVLALLLARMGRSVSTEEFINLLWDGAPPVSAVNVIQKYVGTLRRLLEPALGTRDVGSHLLRRGDSYIFVAGSTSLDLLAFRHLIADGSAALAQERYDAALDYFAEALMLWTGPVADGLVRSHAATSIFTALNDQFFDACISAADLAITMGQPHRVLPSLQLAARMAPLHEPVHASLMLTLSAAGEQAEALSVFRTVRTRLADDLGLDASRTLQSAYQHLLNQTARQSVELNQLRHAGGPASRRQHTAGATSSAAPAHELVGRREELAVLRRAVEPIFADGSGIALVEGEPGAGKTRLLKYIAAEANERGALVAWAGGLEGDATPAMWPWIHAISAVLDELNPPERQSLTTGELGRLLEPSDEMLASLPVGDSGAQFRLFEQVIGVLAQLSKRRPLALVIDDLQWADTASLQLFTHVASRLPHGVAVIGALRDRAPTPGSELEKLLAAASSIPGHRRIRLGPLSMAEVAELIRHETGRDPGDEASAAIHSRTSGNPFFVRELTRFLADGGIIDDAASASGVPATVRDVVRQRIASLGTGATRLLHIAALIGREVELSLLAKVGDHDIESCLAELEPLAALGLLEPTPGDPFTLLFAHDLVREAVTRIAPSNLSPGIHLRIAEALEIADTRADSVDERLAYHLWAAGPLADPARTVAALIRAGRRAVTKSALDAAERQLRLAVRVARDAGSTDLEFTALSQLIAVAGMHSMFGTSTVGLLQRAEHLAGELGLEVEATVLLYSRWAAYAQGVELNIARPLAQRLLNQGEGSTNPLVRAYGLQTWGLQQCSEGNMGEAFRRLTESSEILLARDVSRDVDPVWYDLRLLVPGMLAETTAMYGDVERARNLLGSMESAMGGDPYAVTVWAAHTGRTEALIGDPARALAATERAVVADPDLAYDFMGAYARLARYWARAMTVQDPPGAAVEVERLIAAHLLNPMRSCVATWFGLLGEMYLVNGALEEAGDALTKAEWYMDAYGQRYPEGLILLFQARLLHARGEPEAVVRAAAERSRALSIKRETNLFARRADAFLVNLPTRT